MTGPIIRSHTGRPKRRGSAERPPAKPSRRKVRRVAEGFAPVGPKVEKQEPEPIEGFDDTVPF